MNDVDAGAGDDALSCFGTGIARPCLPEVPVGAIQLSGTINTNTDPRCKLINQPTGGPQLCVLAGGTISLSGPVHAVGGQPLVLVASDKITVETLLDARSAQIELIAGAGASMCDVASGQTGKNTSSQQVGAGGAGGSFQGLGGAGGQGGFLTVGGTVALPSSGFPDHVRGGCPGGFGGEGSATPLGLGGAGGGVIYLIAGNTIEVSGTVAATGAGGHCCTTLTAPSGTLPSGGGGGGGSGGMIVLDAPKVVLGATARLLAHGGSGSAGGSVGATGQPGADPNLMATTVDMIAAHGGQGASGGGNGGDGSSGTNTQGWEGTRGASDGGGGGGGGGAGFIKLLCTSCITSSSAIIIPPST